MSASAAPLAGAAAARVRLRRAVAGALAAGWAGLMFWLSSMSDPFPFAPPAVPGFDKVLHAGAYAVLGGLVALALAGARRPGARAVVVAAALASLYGATDEWHQASVPGRDTSAADWAADAAGAVAGAALAAAFLRRQGAAG